MVDRPVRTNQWTVYEVEDTLDTKSDTLQFGIQGFYTAMFLFDDVKLFIEDEQGDFQEVEILI